MNIKVTPTEKPRQLKENLKDRVNSIEIKNGFIHVETEKKDIIKKTPGIEKFEINGEITEGLKGRPVQEQAYAKIKNKKDLAKALLATINGYDLRILHIYDEWELKRLKKFNPDIKKLQVDEPREYLKIEKSLNGIGETKPLEIKLSDEEAQDVYKFLKI